MLFLVKFLNKTYSVIESISETRSIGFDVEECEDMDDG
jgi:hypothetical protein